MLEVLVAGILLSVGLLATMEVVSRSADATGRTRDHARAMMFARSKMEELLKEPVLQVGTDRGQGVDETTDYDWEVAIEQSAHASLYTILVKVTNRASGKEVLITTLRRPDLNPPETTTPDGTTTTPEPTAPAPTPGGTL